MEQAAQGSGGVTIPGGVQKRCRYGTSGHGLVGMVVMAGLDDLRSLLQPMILWFYDVKKARKIKNNYKSENLCIWGGWVDLIQQKDTECITTHCKTYNTIFEGQKIYFYSVCITVWRSSSSIYLNIGLKPLVLMVKNEIFISNDSTANIFIV